MVHSRDLPPTDWLSRVTWPISGSACAGSANLALAGSVRSRLHWICVNSRQSCHQIHRLQCSTLSQVGNSSSIVDAPSPEAVSDSPAG